MLKYEEACAPNGYYYIPMYDKGNFVIKVAGPVGWTFSPAEVQVNTASEDCPCISGKDINLHITGFAVTGGVVSAGSVDGPAGVSLALMSDGAEVGRTMSTEGGKFVFEGVLPGKYQVSATHDSWRFRAPTTQVTVEMDSTKVAEPFVVEGYGIEGSVVSDGQPVVGVAVYLYADGARAAAPPRAGCQPPGTSDRGPRPDGKPLCVTMSDETGTYRLPHVPPGAYTLVPSYGASETPFEISPKELRAQVSHGSLLVPQRFELLGFSIPGRVVDARGGGVGGAKILIDGVERASTSADGTYTLDKVRSGTFTIEASKENVVFHPLENIQVMPSMARLADLKVSGYKVCGRIVLQASEGGARTAVLRPKDGSVPEQRTQTSASGSFCFEAPTGAYTVAAPITQSERAAGMVLTPTQHEIEVSAGPVLDLVFSQSAVVVAGSVKCIGKCDDDLTVELRPASGQQPLRTYLTEGRFEFRPVVPGTYEVAAVRDGWCWTKATVSLTVGAENVEGLLFEQKGWELAVRSDHPVGVSIKAAEGEVGMDRELGPGESKVCLETAGAYTVRASHKCFQFEPAEQSWSTASARLISWVPARAQLSGSVRVKSASGDEPIKVVVSSETGGKPEHATLQVAERGVWRWTHWVNAADAVTVVPTSSLLLFTPTDARVTVSPGSCPAEVAPFGAHVGRFLKGTVSPAKAGVRISVHSRDSDAVLVEVVTNSDGEYSAGPLFEDAEVVLKAAHEGFHFKGDGAGGFKAVALGHISASVVDEAGGALGGVLLSLSGQQYRNNNATNSEGRFVFSDLFEGKFFLRALLKEYVFKPASKEINMVEAASEAIQFVGKRVAYSVFGAVRSLNGEPEKFCAVEAIADDGKYEETVSGPTGEFRLRGLLPGTKYKIRVKSGEANPRVERAMPSEELVTMGESDRRGMQFVVFRRLTKCDVSGQVNAPAHIRSTLSVQLSVAEKPDVAIATTSMGSVNYFEFPALARGQHYVIKLKSSLSPRQYRIHAPPTPLATMSAHTHLELNFSAEVRNAAEDTRDVSSFYVLGLTVLALCGTIYHKDTMALFERAMAYVSSAAEKGEKKERAEKPARKNSGKK